MLTLLNENNTEIEMLFPYVSETPNFNLKRFHSELVMKQLGISLRYGATSPSLQKFVVNYIMT